MTNPIKLELTLKELQLIDKYVELNDDTQKLFDKIKDAYPKPKTLTQLVERWWCDTFTTHTDWDVDTSIADLVDQVDFWILRNKKTVPVEEPTKPMEEVMDRLENKYENTAASYMTDEVIDRLVKKYQAQKLWNRVRDELGYSVDCCDEIVDLVEEWLPKKQSVAGSQNVDTELLVDGFNHCLTKIKSRLR